MSHSLPYLLGILLVVFVRNMAVWMPPGILLILVLATLSDNAGTAGSQWWAAIVATAITVVVHLATKRRLLWSVGLGTLSYILMLNWL